MAIEERVQIAIDNWAPRFISNGVDPNDFQRVTKRIRFALCPAKRVLLVKAILVKSVVL